MRLLFTLAALILPSAVMATEPQTLRVIGVHDGDTVKAIDAANAQHKIRLQGIDAPEIGQPFGTKSRDRLAALTMGKTVEVHASGNDKYGRTLGTIQIEGTSVNRQMVADGMAWHYTRFDKDPRLAAAEQAARAARRGLWADKEPVPPWDWRASEAERKSALVK